MNVTNAIDRVVKWAQAEICEPVRLKMPPDGDLGACPNAGEYDYRLVTPTAFPLYVPTRDKLPPNVCTSAPSVVVRILEGTDDVNDGTGSMNLEMVFCTWNPGAYGKDILVPDPERAGEFRHLPEEETAGRFEIYTNAWRDVWNWVDLARRKLRNSAHIDGMPIDRSVKMKFGSISPEEGIPELYPLWFAYVSFGLQCPLTVYDAGIQEFL